MVYDEEHCDLAYLLGAVPKKGRQRSLSVMGRTLFSASGVMTSLTRDCDRRLIGSLVDNELKMTRKKETSA
jgi:hypothetical protein